MSTGLNNMIFASGARTSERKPPSAIADTGSEKPGRCASSSVTPGFRTLAGLRPRAPAGLSGM